MSDPLSLTTAAENDAKAFVASLIASLGHSEFAPLAAEITQQVNGDLQHLGVERILFDGVRSAYAEAGEGATVAHVIAQLTATVAAEGDEWATSSLRTEFINLVDVSTSLGGLDPIKHARELLERLRVAYKRRQAESACLDLLAQVKAGEKISGEAFRRVADAADFTNIDGEVNMAQEMANLLAGKVPLCIPTGDLQIDYWLGGGLPIGLTVLAAQPNIGKSAFAMRLAVGALMKNPKITALWAMGEMKPVDIGRRLAGFLWSLADKSQQDHMVAEGCTRLSLSESRHAAHSTDENVINTLAYVGRFLDQRMPVIRPDVFRIETIEAHVALKKPSVLVIDYLQLVRAEGDNAMERLDEVLDRLKRLSLRHEVAVIGITSLARGTRDDAGAGDIGKGSSRLGYDPEVILFGTDTSEKGPEDLAWEIKKNRCGEVGEKMRYRFTGHLMEISGEVGAESFVRSRKALAGSPSKPVERFTEFAEWEEKA